MTTMQIVQFIVDLHLVYFGSKSNVFDLAIDLTHSSSQPILTLRAPIGLNFRHSAIAMERSRPLSLVARYSPATFCSLSNSILRRTRSRLVERNQLRTDTQMGMGLSISMFDSGSQLTTLLNAGSRKIKDAQRKSPQGRRLLAGISIFFYLLLDTTIVG